MTKVMESVRVSVFIKINNLQVYTITSSYNQVFMFSFIMINRILQLGLFF